MNRIWSLSESTEKGEEVGLISGNRPDDRDVVELAEEEWVSQMSKLAQKNELFISAPRKGVQWWTVR
jgi:hypothetical protein